MTAPWPINTRMAKGWLQLLLSSLLLALFALGGSSLVALLYQQTHAKISANQHDDLLQNLNAVVDPRRFNNDIVNDRVTVRAPWLLGTPLDVEIYRARRNDLPIAVVLPVIAPDGYGGQIQLLVAINADGSISGVRTLQHQETPGLGDAIEANKSDWIFAFNGHSLDNLDENEWRVQRDGGSFDQFTGATITPRAVVGAVHRSLIYFRTERPKLLFGSSPQTIP